MGEQLILQHRHRIQRWEEITETRGSCAMGQLLAPSFTSSQQTQQALSHNVTMHARDKLLDEKQLAETQARQGGNDASRKKKRSDSGIF